MKNAAELYSETVSSTYHNFNYFSKKKAEMHYTVCLIIMLKFCLSFSFSLKQITNMMCSTEWYRNFFFGSRHGANCMAQLCCLDNRIHHSCQNGQMDRFLYMLQAHQVQSGTTPASNLFHNGFEISHVKLQHLQQAGIEHVKYLL